MDFPDGAEHVVVFGEHVSFAVIENEGVEMRQELEKIGQGDVEPEVHGIGSDKFWALHLV